MPYTFKPVRGRSAPSFNQLYKEIPNILLASPLLTSRGNRPLQMEFEDQLKALIFFHLEEHHSSQHLLQVLEEDVFAREVIAPKEGIKKSSFSEAINTRGLEQFIYVYQRLQEQAAGLLPNGYPELGELVAVDGSLIDGVFSMHWADYRKRAKKAKVHLGFDLNRSIPRKIFLTNGKGPERPFVSQILTTGQTGVLDRGYQCHRYFDLWQHEKKLFVCRIKTGTKKTLIKTNDISPDSTVFYDAIVRLGTPGVNQTEKELRLIGYTVNSAKYWVATNRFDLSSEQIALIYKLRWDIETFFAWWKRHLKVYHLIARSEHGLMVQILAGLITYLLLAIYCHEQHNEKVSIKRVRELRIQIQNEIRGFALGPDLPNNVKEQTVLHQYAKT